MKYTKYKSDFINDIEIFIQENKKNISTVTKKQIDESRSVIHANIKLLNE